MEQSSSERKQTVRHQFDSFCKLVLHGEKVNYEKEMEYRGRHEISLSQVPEEELSRLNTVDEYIAESEMFRVLDYDIEVKDELISEALKYLPEKKRNVILLSFFMDMSDTEIAKHMNLVRSTIHHHRVSSLQALKKMVLVRKWGDRQLNQMSNSPLILTSRFV